MENILDNGSGQRKGLWMHLWYPNVLYLSWALSDGHNLNEDKLYEVCQLPNLILTTSCLMKKKKNQSSFWIILQTLWENNKRLHIDINVFTFSKRRHFWQQGMCPFTYLGHSLTPIHSLTHVHKLITVKFISYIKLSVNKKKPSTWIASINKWHE